MAHLLSVRQPIGRCIFQPGACVWVDRQRISSALSFGLAFARFASQSKRPPKVLQGAPSEKPTVRPSPESYARKRQIDPHKKAASLLNHLSKVKKKPPVEVKVETPKVDKPRFLIPKVVSPAPDMVAPAEPKASFEPEEEASKTVEIDEKEAYIQQNIVKNRSKLFWPGIWTITAVACTYGGLAFLDAQFSSPSGNDATIPERAHIPQSWFLTPAVITEGVTAGWNELDKLTIGIVIASVGIHFLKNSPLPIWEKLIHITGEKKYTAFLYPFVHSTWVHMGMNILSLCWFLPGVVHHFDNDLFHSAAFFITVPLITSYLQHFAFRWTSVPGIPLNMGSSGAIAAALGAFCVLYPDEKVWTPNFVVFRLDAKYVGALFAVWQIASMVKVPKSGNRPAFMVSTTRVMLKIKADTCRSIQ